MKKQKEQEYKCRNYIFADGRIIKAEDFDAKKDLTEEQSAKIIKAFEKSLFK